MNRRLIIVVCLGFFPFLMETSAQAQSVGVGVGVSVGPRRLPPPGPRYLPPYPFFGAYPLQYPGFYGNGMSLYGPPVPTYGPVPGTFGASDYRVNQNAPWLGFPVGIYATWSPKRHRVNEPLLLDDSIVAPVAADRLLVEVRVPLENVIVFINDQITKQSGVVRYYSSPALQPGETYEYSVRAVWTIDGVRSDRTIVVRGKPGERALADFLK